MCLLAELQRETESKQEEEARAAALQRETESEKESQHRELANNHKAKALQRQSSAGGCCVIG